MGKYGENIYNKRKLNFCIAYTLGIGITLYYQEKENKYTYNVGKQHAKCLIHNMVFTDNPIHEL